LIREHFVVFVASTTGQGEEPDNMKRFWKFLLRKSHPSDALDHMEYTVLGLGDSSYIKYDSIPREYPLRDPITPINPRC